MGNHFNQYITGTFCDTCRNYGTCLVTERGPWVSRVCIDCARLVVARLEEHTAIKCNACGFEYDTTKTDVDVSTCAWHETINLQGAGIVRMLPCVDYSTDEWFKNINLSGHGTVRFIGE